MDGRCTCGTLRYEVAGTPMVVHCYHCSWCQRETGSAFVIKAIWESERLRVTAGDPDYVLTPSASGKGQEIARCPACRVALWSHYPGAGRRASFVRVGAMDAPHACPPDVHIYTSTKQPWVTLPNQVPAFPEFYPSSEGVWPDAGRARWKALLT